MEKVGKVQVFFMLTILHCLPKSYQKTLTQTTPKGIVAHLIG